MAKKSASRPNRTATPVRQQATTAPARRTAAPARSGGSGGGDAAALRAAFTQAARTMAGAWKASREVIDTGGTYEQPQIPDGKYVCQLTSARVDAPQAKKGDKKGQYTPLMEFRLVVRENGDEVGKQLRITHWLTETTWRTLGESLERLFKDLQRLGYETKGMEPDDLLGVAEELSSNKPYVLVSCKTKTTEDGTEYLNVYLNKLVDPADYDIAE